MAMMVELLLLFFGALVIAVALTPVSKWLAPHVGIVAVPRARDVHTAPVPKMGGIAILLGTLLMSLVLGSRPEFQQLAAMLFGAAFMSFLGLLDDRFALSAYIRLPLQLLAALMVWLFGVRIQIFSNPILDVAITMLWIAGITNAMNFLDNMDGLLAGISAVISAFFLVLAIINGQYLVGLLSAAVLGACIGFLFWNLNPASVFMGDSGSMFLGFLLACIAIKLRFLGQSPTISWMVPVIVMSVPIFDMMLVVVSRMRRGKNPLTSPGRDHTSHRLTNQGYSKREAVMILYLVCGALGITAIIASEANLLANIIIAAALLIIAVGMLWYMELGPWRLQTIDWEKTEPQSLPQSSAPINASGS
jgi:UDP-GlcNAc:undecaprenyl-phosphate GlcNAc-1-phosphate transferase